MGNTLSLNRRIMKLARYPSVEAMLAQLTPSYPVFCLHPGRFRAQARRFLDNFPGTVLYAVKCNPLPSVLHALHAAGIRDFDTASLPEVALVHELFDDVTAYFHHPVKSRSAIQSAHEVYGVQFYAVDHADELAKLRQETHGAPVTAMIRLKTAPGYAVHELSTKFGATVEQAAALLRQARGIGMATGLSFHVGSQCRDPKAYEDAIQLAAETLAEARVPIECFNVGGGFPADYTCAPPPPLEDFLDAIKHAIAKFPILAGVKLMCEPGRALVADGASLLVQVQLRRDKLIYINDGIYGSLSEMIYDRSFIPPARRIRLPAGGDDRKVEDFTVFGPTCDANDRLPNPLRLPSDIREGDWIEIGQLGAYSNAVASKFNGFSADTYVEIADAGRPVQPDFSRVAASMAK
jgi:ornithine decarboxylase